MSAGSLPVELSAKAKADYTSIMRFTSRRLGVRQRDLYSELLEETLRTIGANPAIGRERDELRPGLRSFPVGSHVIFYRIRPTLVRVERILHERMDAASRFK